MPSFKVESEQHWHELRAQNVGASECAALFGLSPYITKFTLYHQKAGKISRPDFGTERMEWGNALEPVIAEVLAKKQGWKIRNVKRYLTHKTVKGMGCSLDFEIIGHPDGLGAFEIKNMDYASYKRGWGENEDDSIEAPISIELQLQHQLAVTGYSWGAFGILINGNEGKVIIRQRHEPTIQRIETAVSEFWESIRAGQAPDIESAGDLVAVAQVFSGMATVSLESIEFEDACSQYLACKSVEKRAKKNTDMAKARVIEILDRNAAEIALGQSYKATYKEQIRKEHVVAESRSRVLRVSELKVKGE